MRFRFSALAALAGLALSLTGGTARADSVRVSKGDAQAVLEGFGGGGWAILRHSPVVLGAPADGLRDSLVAIRPLPLWDGNHYCALDWHVIVLAVFDGGDSSYTLQDFQAFASQLSNVFILDGQPFATERTASKRFLRDFTALGITETYYFQEGRVLAPDELAVGTHTLTLVQTFGGVTDSVEISFTVDAAGTGACL